VNIVTLGAVALRARRATAGPLPRLLAAFAACGSVFVPSIVAAQCRPGQDSNEAKLLAHYSAPISFAPLAEPGFAAGRFALGVDVTYIPKPDAALTRTGRCFQPKNEQTQLSPVFPRPRLMVGLPLGIGFEVSWLPPVKVAGAKPNLFSGALSITRTLMAISGHPLIAAARVHATRGEVKGAITCGQDALQQSDPAQPCYGAEKSNDTFRPNMWGIDGSIGRRFMDGRLGLYAGGGYTWLAPRFRVGFADATGYVDRTRVEVDLTRAAAFGGASYQLAGIWSATAQVYSVPADVTLFRLGGAVTLR
jgi:hypothetical protein